jgi:hypothetical protein
MDCIQKRLGSFIIKKQGLTIFIRRGMYGKVPSTSCQKRLEQQRLAHSKTWENLGELYLVSESNDTLGKG